MNNNIFNYTETMQEADEYKMGRRALLPAIYNEQRPNQMPIPRCDFNSSPHSHLQSNEINSTVSSTESETTNVSDSTFGDNSNASDLGLVDLFETSLNHEENLVSSTELLVSFDSVDIQTNLETIDPLIIMPEDVKLNIEFLQMSLQDAEFVENILDVEEDTNRDVCESESQQSNNKSVGEDSEVSNDVEKLVNWEQIDGEGEIFIVPCENMPKPCIKHIDFSVKIDDVISNKIPFATSVSLVFFDLLLFPH